MAHIKFWGVRGSIPTPGPTTVRYGGNTPCVEVRLTEDKFFILDAGSGLRELGLHLLKSGKPIKSNILISHMHWDHIQGIPFFVPALLPGNEFTFYGAEEAEMSIKDILGNQMNYINFPIEMDDMASDLNFMGLQEDSYEVDGIKFETMFLNHPGSALGYKLFINGKSIVYISDNEPYPNDNEVTNEESQNFFEDSNEKLISFVKNVDILIHDGQYTPEEYKSRFQWGHSPYDFTVNVALKANVKQLVIFHHDPVHDDNFIDEIVFASQKMARDAKSKLDVIGAREGLQISLD